MARVSRKWVLKNSNSVKYGGRKINLEDLPVPKGGFDSSLSRSGIKLIEDTKLRKIVKTFQIFIPKLGWAECYLR
jgi:hypothetical protein